MAVQSYHEMIREDREWVYEYRVFLALPSFEGPCGLLGRTVLGTEETGPLLKGFTIYLSRGRHYSGWIELGFDGQATNDEILRLDVLERPEVPACKRPTRKLVVYELIWIH